MKSERQIRGVQRYRHEADWVLMLTVVALTALGILMVYSSSGVPSAIRNSNPFAVVGPQATWAALGLAAMFIATRIDFRYWRLVSVAGIVFALVLLVLVLLPDIGPLRTIETNGSARWLQIGPLPSMHPAEFAKLGLVIYLAHWLDKRGARAGSLLGGMVPFLVIVGPILALVLIEPDLGTMGVLALTAFTMFFVAGGSIIQLALLAPPAAAALVFMVQRSSYQMDRVNAFINPWADPQGLGFHTVQGLLALGSGGLFGIGLGESHQPGALYVPQAQNDFVFAIIGQELGLVGGVVVIGLYLLLAYRGIRIALGAPDTFSALLAIGVTAWLTFQAFINIAVVVVLMPVTGITLPFISAGGSSLVVSFAAVGILLSISRETAPRVVSRSTGGHENPDRRRRDWRAHLPGLGRRAVPARAVN
jgi:cell division protein FtsW